MQTTRTTKKEPGSKTELSLQDLYKNRKQLNKFWRVELEKSVTWSRRTYTVLRNRRRGLNIQTFEQEAWEHMLKNLQIFSREDLTDLGADLEENLRSSLLEKAWKEAGHDLRVKLLSTCIPSPKIYTQLLKQSSIWEKIAYIANSKVTKQEAKNLARSIDRHKEQNVAVNRFATKKEVKESLYRAANLYETERSIGLLSLICGLHREQSTELVYNLCLKAKTKKLEKQERRLLRRALGCVGLKTVSGDTLWNLLYESKTANTSMWRERQMLLENPELNPTMCKKMLKNKENTGWEQEKIQHVAKRRVQTDILERQTELSGTLAVTCLSIWSGNNWGRQNHKLLQVAEREETASVLTELVYMTLLRSVGQNMANILTEQIHYKKLLRKSKNKPTDNPLDKETVKLLNSIQRKEQVQTGVKLLSDQNMPVEKLTEMLRRL